MEEEPVIANFELTGFNDFSSTEEDEEEVKEEDNTKKPKNKSKSKIVSKKLVFFGNQRCKRRIAFPL